MPRSIKTQIFVLILFILLAQLVRTLILVYIQKQEMKADAFVKSSQSQMRQAGRLCKSAWLICNLDYKHVRQELDKSYEKAVRHLDAAGQVTLGQSKEVTVKAAKGGKELRINLPSVSFGSTQVALNYDPAKPSVLVDEITRDIDIDMTIWQRISESGDMLRLSANWKTADGQRGVGTYEKSDDSEWQPIIADILKGRKHYCSVIAVDKKFSALFVPLFQKDANGNKVVVGMVGFGFGMKDIVRDIKDSLSSLQLGNSGYIGILKASGNQCSGGKGGRGYVVLEHDNTEEGKNYWDTKVGGTYPAREIINAAVKTQKGGTAIVNYKWQEHGDQTIIDKTAAVTYFEPFDWVIFAGVNNDEFTAMSADVDDNLNEMLLSGLLGDIILMAVAALIAVLLLNKIVRPINRIVDTAEVIATGNLVEASKLLPAADTGGHNSSRLTSQETQALWKAMEKMTGNLASLVSKVQNSGSQLLDSAENIRNNASSQKEAIADFEAHVSHIAAAISEISATSQELSRTMSGIKENSSQAAEIAATGQEGLHGMEQMLHRLSEETASISSRLAMINEKANNIDSMVVTITKVAEQTNLLSLNAAIEAEKAGEYGLGFSVVAREIRRLADQTALATLDIEQMVEQMRSSVSQGVMEMERFTQDVRQSVENGGKINSQLSTVIKKVQELTPRFEKVSEGMTMQSQGARQISQSMGQLSDAAKELSQTFDSFNSSSDKLRDEADDLRNEVSRFKVE